MRRFNSIHRRRFLQHSAFATAAFATPGLFAEELTRTPRQTEGPFYPNKLPRDTDNDLLILNDSITPAVGQITHLTGRVLSAAGEPVRNAVVEIWQTDNHGIYIHTRGGSRQQLDSNFQGFGRFLTDSTGQYYFRTIKPVMYQPRTPHIHVAINQNGHRMLTTQLYVKGEPLNKKDFILREVTDAQARASIIVEFKPVAGSKHNELAANFDVVIGQTPEDPDSNPSGAGRRAGAAGS